MGLFDNFFSKPNALPSLPAAPQAAQVALQQPQLPNAQGSIGTFLQQQQQFPQLQNFYSGLNTNFQSQLFNTLPTLQGNLGQFGKNTSSLLAGNIPTDVQTQIADADAQKATAGGIGGGSAIGKNLTARDFGLTSLNLMQEGAQNLNQQVGQGQALNPYNMGQALFSPQAIMAQGNLSSIVDSNVVNQQALYNAGAQTQSNLSAFDVAAQNNQIAYANSNMKSPFENLINSTLGSLISAPFNAIGGMAAGIGGGGGLGGAGGGGSYQSTNPWDQFGQNTGSLASSGNYNASTGRSSGGGLASLIPLLAAL